jgi:hypothetical protein
MIQAGGQLLDWNSSCAQALATGKKLLFGARMYSPAQRSVRAGARKANSYQFLV